jgi:phosphotransferase system enzyme I (PtsP)
MMKASEGLGNLRILLPMVSNVPELEEALVLLRRSHRELVEDGLDAPMPQVGVMVEVPSAVYQARALARRVEFLSVGSNDLTQYLLAVDRNNARVSDLYHAFHPAVLAALAQVAEGARAEGKSVSICGELAGNPMAAVVLLAMGYDVLSMNATSLPRVKRALRAITAADARAVWSEVRYLDSADEIQERLRGFLHDRGLQEVVPAPID